MKAKIRYKSGYKYILEDNFGIQTPIRLDVQTTLVDMHDVEIVSVLSPAWTTDWLTDTGREKLRAYGIAPPVGSAGSSGGTEVSTGGLTNRSRSVRSAAAPPS